MLHLVELVGVKVVVDADVVVVEVVVAVVASSNSSKLGPMRAVLKILSNRLSTNYCSMLCSNRGYYTKTSATQGTAFIYNQEQTHSTKYIFALCS